MKRIYFAVCFVVLLKFSLSSLQAAPPVGTMNADTTRFHLSDISVTAERVRSAASDEQHSNRDLQLFPLSSSQDVLRLVPGLILAQHAGGGKAEQIFLRGFDCDHGTDVSISVDDSPVNMVSHGHGQGYADIHFVIPEAIESINVLKGPYFASYGDQATAGVVRIRTADTLANNVLKAELGMFETYRAVALLGTKLSNSSVYAGTEFLSTRGYFDASQDFVRTNTMVKVYSSLTSSWVLTASAFIFSSRWNASGQIPERAVSQGLLSSFGSVDSLEGGSTARTTMQMNLKSNGPEGWTINAGVTRYRFNLFSNFTFFAHDHVRGDMIEQTDLRNIVHCGAQTQRAVTLFQLPSQLHVGAMLRYDDIATALYHDQERQRLSTTVDAEIHQLNAGLFAEQSVFINDLTVVIGLRVDAFHFAVHDRQTQLIHSRDCLLLSPKLNATYDLNESWTLFFNSGLGFHSNDARAVVQAQNRNFLPRALGSEVGTRLRSGNASISVATWLLDVESELVWSGDQGTTDISGRTRRIGIDADIRVELFSNTTIGVDLCTAHGRYRDEAEGRSFIPLAPSLTLTAFCSYQSRALSVALHMRHISDRPANEDGSLVAAGYTIVDLKLNVPLSESFELTMECRNLLNTAWKEAQFDTTSRLLNETAAVSDIHFTSGTPLNAKLGASIHF